MLYQKTLQRSLHKHTVGRISAASVDKQVIRNYDAQWQAAFAFITLESRAGQIVHRWLIGVIEFGLGHVIGNVIGACRRGLF